MKTRRLLQACEGGKCLRRISCARFRATEHTDEAPLDSNIRTTDGSGLSCPKYVSISTYPGPFWSWQEHLASQGLLEHFRKDAEHLRSLSAR